MMIVFRETFGYEKWNILDLGVLLPNRSALHLLHRSLCGSTVVFRPKEPA